MFAVACFLTLYAIYHNGRFVEVSRMLSNEVINRCFKGRLTLFLSHELASSFEVV